MWESSYRKDFAYYAMSYFSTLESKKELNQTYIYFMKLNYFYSIINIRKIEFPI